MSTSTDLARSILRQLIEFGVSDFVLSPGSRNAPLSIALVEARDKGLIDLHIKLDERGAAFFALGISKATDKYVAVICTSGTAVANYHPAVLEALHANNKLLVLSADRPASLRNTGANQTTNQVDIFPGIKTHDLAAPEKITLDSGPIHLNIQFEEPLRPTDEFDWLDGLKVKPTISKEANSEILEISGNGVIIIGHDKAGLEVIDFAEQSGLPIISEDPLSFKNSVRHASIILTDEKVREYLKPDFVIVIGRTTLSRSTNAYIQSAGKTYVIDSRTVGIDSKRTATKTYTELPKLIIDEINQQWISDWREVAKVAAQEATTDWSEQKALELLSAEIPNGSSLFVGSSRPIRDIEGFAKPRNGLTVFANRGLAGIDGNTSTIFGIATRFESNYAVIGDLTFLHDLSALIDLPDANLTIFVIDNNGGGIFSTLPQAGVRGFEEAFGTPQNQNIEKIAQAFGISTEVIKGESDLKRSIAHNQKGLHLVIIEVPSREANAQKLKEVYARVSKAVRIGFNLA